MGLADAAIHTVVRVKFPALHTRVSFAAPHQVNAPIPRGANEMKSDEISYTNPVHQLNDLCRQDH